jgi:hypothetical protein
LVFGDPIGHECLSLKNGGRFLASRGAGRNTVVPVVVKSAKLCKIKPQADSIFNDKNRFNNRAQLAGNLVNLDSNAAFLQFVKAKLFEDAFVKSHFFESTKECYDKANWN